MTREQSRSNQEQLIRFSEFLKGQLDHNWIQIPDLQSRSLDNTVIVSLLFIVNLEVPSSSGVVLS